MTVVLVDGVEFEFPDGWTVTKYDDWAFYRRQFQRLGGGCHAVDLLALSPNRELFLIEVKDYSRPGTPVPSQLVVEVGFKVRDTLAGLLAARVRANDPDERRLAILFSKNSELKVVLHVELSRYAPLLINKSSIQQKLRQTVRAVDPHARVSDVSLTRTPWTTKHVGP